MVDYQCNCGARFRSPQRYEEHRLAHPRLCLKAARKVLSPEKYAADNPSEHGQQVAIFMWAALPEIAQQFPALEYMFAIPNGGLRDRITASRLKAEGVKDGVPDIFLPAPMKIQNQDTKWISWTNCCGLFIEMKRPATQTQKAGRLSDAQGVFATYLTHVGYVVATCYGFEEARAVIVAYMAGNLVLVPPSAGTGTS